MFNYRPWTNKLDSEYTLVGSILITPPRNEQKKSNQIKNLSLTFKEMFISLVDHNTPKSNSDLNIYRWTTSPKMNEWMNQRMIEWTSFLEENMDRIALNNPLCIDNSVSKYE